MEAKCKWWSEYDTKARLLDACGLTAKWGPSERMVYKDVTWKELTTFNCCCLKLAFLYHSLI